MENILVIGGAGFIGSHMVKMLLASGYEVTVLDNLSTGHADAVVDGATLCVGDLRDEVGLDSLFQATAFDAVIHFAACSQVGESMTDPAKYYQNNVSGTLNLLQAMCRHGVKRLIFSSTAAVYGHPESEYLREDLPLAPINPYGQSKLMVETMLRDFDRAQGLKSICLRYFNAAGADPQGALGERHEPETHLIPLVLQAASGRRKHISVFGQDYATADGTCVRDYVHVQDLCRAHELALEKLLAGGESDVFNLGNGEGFSVQQVIDAARRVTGCSIPQHNDARRPGDPPRLVAASDRARSVLGWQPAFSSLETMIRHAWQWETRDTAPAVASKTQPTARLSRTPELILTDDQLACRPQAA